MEQMMIQTKNGETRAIDRNIYEAIVMALKDPILQDQWYTYAELFSAIKPTLVVTLGAAVWYVAPVIESLVLQGVLVTKMEAEAVYKIV